MDCESHAAQDCSSANITIISLFLYQEKVEIFSVLFILICTSRCNARTQKEGSALIYTATELGEPQCRGIPKPEGRQQS